MANYISNSPAWVIVLFIAGFLYSLAIIANPVKKAALNVGMTTDSSRKIQWGIIGFFIAYLIYVSIFSLRGVFDVNSIPPKIFIFTTLPLTFLLFAIAGNTGIFKKLLRSISLESLIAMHVFRILGVFFFILYFYHLIPGAFAFSAATGDIVTAIFALPVAKMVAERKPWNIPVVYIWNIFGILDIVSLLILAVINARDSAVTGIQGNQEMTMFPFVWFPAFAPATILFLHATIFRKLQQINNN